MKKILLLFVLVLCFGAVQGQNLKVRRLTADSIYFLKSSVLLSDTAIVMSNGKFYKRILSDTAFLQTLIDSAWFADTARLLQGLDTTAVFLGAAGQTGQCNNAYRDTVGGCATKWTVFIDSVEVKGKIDCDTAYYIDGIRTLYQGSGNIYLGTRSRGYIITGSGNTALGNDAIGTGTTVNNSTGVGLYSLNRDTSGTSNTAIGAYSLYLTNGAYNIGLGTYAGGRTGNLDYRLFINSIDRPSKKADTTQSIIYGKQDADSSLQDLWLNANVKVQTKLTVGGSFNFAVDTNTSGADSYEIAIPEIATYVTGQYIVFSAAAANTGGCTLQINGLAAKALKSLHDQDPADNYIEAASMVMCVYDGTNFQIVSPDANP